jgi:hypothetical protein
MFETDYATVIHPVGMVLRVRAHIPNFPQDVVLPFKVDDILSAEEATFMGSGKFIGIEGTGPSSTQPNRRPAARSRSCYL